MDVLILLLFVSMVLVAGAVLLLLSRVKGGDFEHGDRLSLLPLDHDFTAANRSDRSETESQGGESKGS